MFGDYRWKFDVRDIYRFCRDRIVGMTGSRFGAANVAFRVRLPCGMCMCHGDRSSGGRYRRGGWESSLNKYCKLFRRDESNIRVDPELCLLGRGSL